VQAFVKVSMDGTPYLRKVDVAAYDDYGELVEALNELFCCCSIGKLSRCCPCAKTHTYALEENELKNCWRVLSVAASCCAGLMDGYSEWEHAVVYEDGDGDWMLVGDVPWE
jgi:auxin-responsive protein IAA